MNADLIISLSVVIFFILSELVLIYFINGDGTLDIDLYKILITFAGSLGLFFLTYFAMSDVKIMLYLGVAGVAMMVILGGFAMRHYSSFSSCYGLLGQLNEDESDD